jgi:hypothetical protein
VLGGLRGCVAATTPIALPCFAARVVHDAAGDILTLGRPDAVDAFVVAADDLKVITTSAQLALINVRKCSLSDDGLEVLVR